MRSAKQRKAWSKLPRHVRAWIRSQPLSKWAKRIKREFDKQCAMCAKTTSLEAHHIYLKSLYPSKIEDLDNGLSLCTKCHDSIHSLYISDRDKYWIVINAFVSKRSPMKTIKKAERNPSSFDYTVSLIELPVEIAVDGDLPETIAMKKRKSKVEELPDIDTTQEGTKVSAKRASKKVIKPNRVVKPKQVKPIKPVKTTKAETSAKPSKVPKEEPVAKKKKSKAKPKPKY